MRINLWLGVPKTIGNLFSGGHDPQVENCCCRQILNPIELTVKINYQNTCRWKSTCHIEHTILRWKNE